MSDKNDASRNSAGGNEDFNVDIEAIDKVHREIIDEMLETEYVPVFIEIKSTQHDMTGLGFFSELSEDYDPDELLEDAGSEENAADGEYVLKTEGEMSVYQRIAISYLERDENGDPGCITEISFKADEPSVIMISRSLPEMQSTSFVIEKGKRNYSVYETPYGPIEMCAFGKLVENTVGEDGGEIRLVYSVELKGLTAQRTDMRIKVRRLKI